MRIKEESDKVGLKFNLKKLRLGIQFHHSWQIEREKVAAVTEFLFLGSKITVDSNCSHEIERRLLLGRKVTTNHFADKGPYSQDCGLSNSHVRM